MDSLAVIHDPTAREVLRHFMDSVANSGGSVLGKAGGNWVVDRFGRFYKKHIGSEDVENQVTSLERLVAFYEALDSRLIALEARGATTAKLKATFSDPQASRMIEAACVAATETTDHGKREALADLVAQRVAANNETSYALYLRRATDAVRDLQPRHLAIVGEMHLIQEIPFPAISDLKEFGFKQYEAWLDDALQRLDVADPSVEDMQYLQSLGMVVTGPPSQVLENTQRYATHENQYIQGLIARGLPERMIRSSDAVKRAARLLDARSDSLDRDFAKIALADYRLTGPGEVLAVTVMRQRGLGEFNVNFGLYDTRGEIPKYRVRLEEHLTMRDSVTVAVVPVGTAQANAEE